jgi:hypothetical protein
MRSPKSYWEEYKFDCNYFNRKSPTLWRFICWFCRVWIWESLKSLSKDLRLKD